MEVNKPYLITNICRYYKGGNINPFKPRDPRNGFWSLEWEFINDYFQQNERLEREYTLDFAFEFGISLEEAPYGAIFRPLKAFLFARYYNSGGSAKGFPDYLDFYLQYVS